MFLSKNFSDVHVSVNHIHPAYFFLTVWPYLQGVWYGRRGTWHHSSKSSRIKGETLSQYPPDILWQWKLTVVIHEFSVLKGENVHNFIIILEQHTSICASFSYLTSIYVHSSWVLNTKCTILDFFFPNCSRQLINFRMKITNFSL